MKHMLMAVLAVAVAVTFSAPAFANDEKKEDKKGGQVVYSDDKDDKKEEKKGGHAIYSEEKKEEKKGGH